MDIAKVIELTGIRIIVWEKYGRHPSNSEEAQLFDPGTELVIYRAIFEGKILYSSREHGAGFYPDRYHLEILELKEGEWRSCADYVFEDAAKFLNEISIEVSPSVLEELENYSSYEKSDDARVDKQAADLYKLVEQQTS